MTCRNYIGRCLKTSNLYFGHTANMPLCQISKTDEHYQLMTDHLLKRVNGSDWSVNLAPPPKVITLCLKVGLKHPACEEELYFWLHLNTQTIPLA